MGTGLQVPRTQELILESLSLGTARSLFIIDISREIFDKTNLKRINLPVESKPKFQSRCKSLTVKPKPLNRSGRDAPFKKFEIRILYQIQYYNFLELYFTYMFFIF